MKPNVGTIDRILRIAVGLALVAAAILLDHPYAWAGWIGVIPIVTGFAGFCPAYRLLGLSTCPLRRH